MASNDEGSPPDFSQLEGLSPRASVATILGWWPSKEDAANDILLFVPEGTSLTARAVWAWQGKRGIPRRWAVPLFRAIYHRFGIQPTALSKSTAHDKAGALQRLQARHGLEIDWSVIEPLMADRVKTPDGAQEGDLDGDS